MSASILASHCSLLVAKERSSSKSGLKPSLITRPSFNVNAGWSAIARHNKS